jgi:MoaA/NifB/PqqE/SkfB family radical SAM enzyme
MSEWYRDEDSKIGKYQREIANVSGTSTFCILPWIHLATRPNGDMRLCCSANASGAGVDHAIGIIKENGNPLNFSKTTPSDAWNSEYMKSVRKTMVEGNIPASCTKCFDEEKHGVVSKRIWETGHWYKDEGVDISNLLDNTQKDGSVPEKLLYLDLRLGHTCNIKCIMCSPHDSSKWVRDWEKLYPNIETNDVKIQLSWDRKEFNNQWYEKGLFWNEIYQQIPNLKQVYFAGGEPLIIKEHKKFIKEIIKQGYQHQILLRYNSNGILVDNELIDLWSQFKKVKFAISIDACFERDEYIRYPTKFREVENTLRLLDNSPDNIHISIATAIQIFNVMHLPDFAKWKIQNNFKKINDGLVADVLMGGGIFNMHLLYIPTFLSITILPKEYKEKVRQKYLEFKSWLWQNYTQDEEFWNSNPYGWKRWEAVLDHMDSSDDSHLLPGFKEYVNKLDYIRKLDASKIFPELKDLL